MTQDEQFMKEAIRLSRQAVEHGNEPFGAVLVKDGQIEAQGKHEQLLEHCALYREMWQAHIGAKDGDAE